MDVNSAFPSKYLKASDLQGRDVNVKMGRVEQETLGDDLKLILYFQGKEKGMVLNKTNAHAIADAYGGETEDWYGQPITIFEQMVDFQGKRVPGLRVRAPRRDAPQRQAAPSRQAAQQRRELEPVGDEAPPHRNAPRNDSNDMDDEIPF